MIKKIYTVVEYILDDSVLNFQHHLSVLAKVITCLSLFMPMPCTKMPKIGPLSSIFPLNETETAIIFYIVVQYTLGDNVLNFQHHSSLLAKVITYRVSKYAFCSVKNKKIVKKRA